MITTILNIQPRVATSLGSKSPDEIVIEKCKELKKGLPDLLDRSKAKKELFKENKQGLI